jgi:hypothetical protein
MKRTRGGEKLNLNNDGEILSIKSPRDRVCGPDFVVYKNVKDRWAIVALRWDKRPRLGIRWFYESTGHPVSNGWPVWFMIPVELHAPILDSLHLEKDFRKRVDDFLNKQP